MTGGVERARWVYRRPGPPPPPPVHPPTHPPSPRQNTGTGGSNGATMRYSPEANWGANAGLAIARDLLEPVKAKFPWIR